MNTTRITYYIHDNIASAPTGDCKTIAAAKQLAVKHGVSMIYARQNGALNGSAILVFDIAESGRWELLSADEKDFATYNKDQTIEVSKVIGRKCDLEIIHSIISEPSLKSVALQAWADKNPTAIVRSLRPTTLELALRKPRDQFQGISEADICERASDILKARYAPSVKLTSPQSVVRYFRASLEHLESEQFHVLFLDSQHKMIKSEVLARGTIDGASIFPREVVKAALAANAGAVVFAHNHPSGLAEASGADKAITTRLIAALLTVDIRCLDHVIIGGGEFTSFAQKGWL
tara:strand:- start:19190 stop:20062 length:873 start_codon:yes stop_codon:yes gene_type:complete